MIPRFERRHIVGHLIMLITFTGLVITGFPQKFPTAGWAKGVVLIFGGVSRMRFVHHLLRTIMALQLVYHVLELLWVLWVRKMPPLLLPTLQDAKDFVLQIKYNLGMASHEPQYGRYSWPEKLEYLALVWGTFLMVATGIIMLYPVRFAQYVPGQFILAAKAAHGGEATLAALAIIGSTGTPPCSPGSYPANSTSKSTPANTPVSSPARYTDPRRSTPRSS